MAWCAGLENRGLSPVIVALIVKGGGMIIILVGFVLLALCFSSLFLRRGVAQKIILLISMFTFFILEFFIEGEMLHQVVSIHDPVEGPCSRSMLLALRDYSNRLDIVRLANTAIVIGIGMVAFLGLGRPRESRGQV